MALYFGSLEEVHECYILRVRSGEIIPIDGGLTEGRSKVDEAMITGEPYSGRETEGRPSNRGDSQLDQLVPDAGLEGRRGHRAVPDREHGGRRPAESTADPEGSRHCSWILRACSPDDCRRAFVQRPSHGLSHC